MAKSEEAKRAELLRQQQEARQKAREEARRELERQQRLKLQERIKMMELAKKAREKEDGPTISQQMKITVLD